MSGQEKFIMWVPLLSLIPGNAVRAGSGKGDSTKEIIVGRVFKLGHLIPAKIIPEFKIGVYTFEGKTRQTRDAEVMAVANRTVCWVAAKDGEIPPNATVVGRTPDEEPIYAARVILPDFAMCALGYLKPSDKEAHILYEKKDHVHKEYEILTVD